MTLLAAERGTNVRAAVDFAGASMTWAHNAPLRERLKRAVRAAPVPIFFLQADNDFDITPTQVLSAEKPGNPSKIYPPHGTTKMEGHAGFCNKGQGEWGQDVLDFLVKSGVSRAQ
jgi:hypothetical protein